MTKPRDPDAILSAFLADGMQVLPDRVVELVLAEVHRTRRRTVVGPWQASRRVRSALGAAAVIAVLVIGGAFFVMLRGQPAVIGPEPTPSPSPTPSQPAAIVGPSATSSDSPTAAPGPTPTPLLWTEASVDDDWPAPVRVESSDGAIVVPLGKDGVAADPSGDTGSADHPWVDIRELSYSRGLRIKLVSNAPPDVHPTKQWIAYGFVFDLDRDGVPDRRIGIDNSPRTVDGQHQGRDWVTDLQTGRTLVSMSDFVGEFDDGKDSSPVWMDVELPDPDTDNDGARFNIWGGATYGGTLGRPFYAWASVIEDGRVVATDYAPDVGWLVSSRHADTTNSGPTPRVEGSPGPTPRVRDDPNVPGGRLWTVKVVNNSDRPATLVVAEETEEGHAGRLVGTVSPSVVPPGATVKVTFALPAKGPTGWSIFVNPGPDTGPLLVWTEVPLAGEIRIGAHGSVGWLSP